MVVIDPYLNNCCCGSDCSDPFTYDFENAASWYLGLDIEVPSVASIGLPQRRFYLKGYTPYCPPSRLFAGYKSRCCKRRGFESPEGCPPEYINCCNYFPAGLAGIQQRSVPRFCWRELGYYFVCSGPSVTEWYKENITGGNDVLLSRVHLDTECVFETIFCCNDAIDRMTPGKYSLLSGVQCADFFDHQVQCYIDYDLYLPWTSSYIRTYSPTIPPEGGIQLPVYVILCIYNDLSLKGICRYRDFYPGITFIDPFAAELAGESLYYGVLDLPFSTSKVMQLQFLDFRHSLVWGGPLVEMFADVLRLLTDMNIKFVFESIETVQPVVWNWVHKYRRSGDGSFILY